MVDEKEETSETNGRWCPSVRAQERPPKPDKQAQSITSREATSTRLRIVSCSLSLSLSKVTMVVIITEASGSCVCEGFSWLAFLVV